ncbi:helix-turn-helix domain-containing protein [Candidatus Pacearchaeota archaeon]|nr:helix-turn-helix domain-containing protein [Candidatus Pacearchaeota archaeon]
MKQELKEFGLTDNEVKIYLALLELGTATPSELAEKAGFSRAYVYDALERLLEKQMVSTILIKNKRNYKAVSPKELREIAKQWLEKVEKIIPQLESIQSKSREEIKVELHKGGYTYKLMLKDIASTLSKGEEVLIFGIDDEYLMKNDEFYETHLVQYYARLKKLKIKERIIAKKSPVLYKTSSGTTRVKYLPKRFIGNVAFEVYGNKVILFFWGKPNYLITIENKEAAESYKNQFEILWKHAKQKLK